MRKLALTIIYMSSICLNLGPINVYKLFTISQILSVGNILAKRFLDEIILDLFSCARTEKKQKKNLEITTYQNVYLRGELSYNLDF